MMKLYFVPETVSLAAHAVMLEIGLPFELIKVNLMTMQTSNGGDFTLINPNAYMPALILEDGKIMTESTAILQYLGDLKPEMKLTATFGTWERVEMWEALNFVIEEIHALCLPLFMPAITDEVRAMLAEKLKKRLTYMEHKLVGRTYAMGNHFTIVDALIYPIFEWMPRFTIDLYQWPAIIALMKRLRSHPSIMQALSAEAMYPPV